MARRLERPKEIGSLLTDASYFFGTHFPFFRSLIEVGNSTDRGQGIFDVFFSSPLCSSKALTAGRKVGGDYNSVIGR